MWCIIVDQFLSNNRYDIFSSLPYASKAEAESYGDESLITQTDGPSDEIVGLMPPEFLDGTSFSQWFSLTAQDRRKLSNRPALKQLNWPKDNHDEIAFNDMILAKLRSDPEFVWVFDNEIQALHSGRKKDTKKLTAQLQYSALKIIPPEEYKKIKENSDNPANHFYNYLNENFHRHSEIFIWFTKIKKFYYRKIDELKEINSPVRKHDGNLSGEYLALLGNRLDDIVEHADDYSTYDKFDDFWQDYIDFGKKIGNLFSERVNSAIEFETTTLTEKLVALKNLAQPLDASRIDNILQLLSSHDNELNFELVRKCRNEVSDLERSVKDLTEIEEEISQINDKIKTAAANRDWKKEEELDTELKQWKPERNNLTDDIDKSLKFLSDNLSGGHNIVDSENMHAPATANDSTDDLFNTPNLSLQNDAELLRIAEEEIVKLTQEKNKLAEENHKLRTKIEVLASAAIHKENNSESEEIIPKGISENELREFSRNYLKGKVELQPNAFNFPKKSVYKDPETMYRALLLLRDYYYPMNLPNSNSGKDLRNEWKEAYLNLNLKEKNSPFDKDYPDERLLQNSRNHEPETGLNIYFSWDKENQWVTVRSLPINLIV